jgi:hypothetical protein
MRASTSPIRFTTFPGAIALASLAAGFSLGGNISVHDSKHHRATSSFSEGLTKPQLRLEDVAEDDVVDKHELTKLYPFSEKLIQFAWGVS